MESETTRATAEAGCPERKKRMQRGRGSVVVRGLEGWAGLRMEAEQVINWRVGKFGRRVRSLPWGEVALGLGQARAG